METRKFAELGRHLTENKGLQPNEIMGMIAVNYYHLLGLLWERTDEKPTESYAGYLYALCMGYFAALVKATNNDYGFIDEVVSEYKKTIGKKNFTVQEYIVTLLEELDTTSSAPNTPIMAKMATLNQIMEDYFPELKAKDIYATAQKIVKN